MAREIDNMKRWTDNGLEVAGEIDNMKRWTDGGLVVAGEIDNFKHWMVDWMVDSKWRRILQEGVNGLT